ncbi:hypothetical protein B9479_008298, partial [Cryptococcus floricola]
MAQLRQSQKVEDQQVAYAMLHALSDEEYRPIKQILWAKTSFTTAEVLMQVSAEPTCGSAGSEFDEKFMNAWRERIVWERRSAAQASLRRATPLIDVQPSRKRPHKGGSSSLSKRRVLDPLAEKRSGGLSRSVHVPGIKCRMPYWHPQPIDLDHMYPPTLMSKKSKKGLNWTERALKKRHAIEEIGMLLSESKSKEVYAEGSENLFDRAKLLAAKTGCDIILMVAHPLVTTDHNKPSSIPYLRTFFTQGFNSVHHHTAYNSQEANAFRPRSVPSSPVLRSLSPRTPSCSPPPFPLPPAEDPPTLSRPEGPPPMVWDLEDRTTTIRVTRPDRLFWVPPPTFLILGPYEVPHPPRRYYDAAVLSHMVIRTSDDDDLGQLMYLIRYLADWRQPNSE